MIVILEKFVNCKPIKLSEYPYQVWKRVYQCWSIYQYFMFKFVICNLISLLFQLLKKRRIVSLVSERRFFLNFLSLLAWVCPECLLLKWAWYSGVVLVCAGAGSVVIACLGEAGWNSIWVWPVCMFLKWACTVDVACLYLTCVAQTVW